MPNTDPITAWIALYAAVVSSIALGWNIYRALTDKGKLRVHCSIGDLIIPDGPEDENDCLVYKITNVGRKPVLVTHIGGTMKEKNFLISPNQIKWPKWLDPREYLLECTADLSILNDSLLCLWASDSLEKTYKVKKRVLKDLIKKGKEKSKSASWQPTNKAKE